MKALAWVALVLVTLTTGCGGPEIADGFASDDSSAAAPQAAPGGGWLTDFNPPDQMWNYLTHSMIGGAFIECRVRYHNEPDYFGGTVDIYELVCGTYAVQIFPKGSGGPPMTKASFTAANPPGSTTHVGYWE